MARHVIICCSDLLGSELLGSCGIWQQNIDWVVSADSCLEQGQVKCDNIYLNFPSFLEEVFVICFLKDKNCS